MLMWKCRMCGGDLTLTDAAQEICTCEYCGSKMPVPNGLNEEKIQLYNRANHFRSACEFDKAAAMYGQILDKDGKEAEAFWGLCLCNYGIEYVIDPKTQRRIPTCHRTVYKSILQDENYKQAIESASPAKKLLYRMEAEYIEQVQKRILAISAEKEPVDIFISYKETDRMGRRTIDSVLSQECYDVLSKAGYKVFFSRISLEKVIGETYEPYIFSALASAKIMLVVTTSSENVNSVWVKNEWSRYLKMAEDDSRKKLVVAYKDMDPYDLPLEFGGIQSLNMGTLGYTQDLLRGVQKLLGEAKQESRPIRSTIEADADRLVKNAEAFIRLHNYNDARDSFEKATKKNPEDWRAWWGLYRLDANNLSLTGKEKISDFLIPQEIYYKNAIAMAPDGKKNELIHEYNSYWKQREYLLNALAQNELKKSKAAENKIAAKEKEWEEINQSQINAIGIIRESKQNIAVKQEELKQADKEQNSKGGIFLYLIIGGALCLFIPEVVLETLYSSGIISEAVYLGDDANGSSIFIVCWVIWVIIVLFLLMYISKCSSDSKKKKYNSIEEEINNLYTILASVENESIQYANDMKSCQMQIESLKQDVFNCNNGMQKANELMRIS